ncbi:methyltransferase [Motiliproteus sediminis]|uniref:methyltransferase n=1 Tax=Motiliproteus sediminis TaxID=1468178 RepID=UPI001AEFF579|nr:methyltransferase [Motiliproteus sediminis]
MTTTEERCNTDLGSFALHRYPRRKQETLRAWDAADELMLNHLARQQGEPIPPSPLILNDHFGALAVPLHGTRPISVSDSYISQLSTRANLESNGLDPTAVTLEHSLTPLPPAPPLVLIKIPKTLALLEHQLRCLREVLQPQSRIVAGAMLKTLQPSVFVLFERCIGPVTTSLAKKKARLLFAQFDPALEPGPSPFPSRYTLESPRLELVNHANLFSREKLDIGTRLLLANLPTGDHYRDIMDLGCGNGVLGVCIAREHPDARLYFRDESFMAVASAEHNFRTAYGETRPAHFDAGDCLTGVTDNSLDLILNNPPFHQQNAVGDHIARRMFAQSLRALRPGGELWVIGNRHLSYHVQLKKLFGNCRVAASNPKFVVLVARKR